MAEAVVIDDYYSVLQVPQSASLSTIREAYKRLALRFHPDKNKDDTATSDFQRLAIAWETLKDATSRAEYDRTYIRIVKRKREEEDEVTSAWKKRKDEVEREASAQWARHAQSSNRAEQQQSSNEAGRSERAMAWKAKGKTAYLTRLGRWVGFRDNHVTKIQDCLREVRKQKMDLEKYAMDNEAIKKARVSGSEIPGFVEALERMLQARKEFTTKLAQDAIQCRNRLQRLLMELEDDRRRYELEEAEARKEQIREALEMLGPRDLNPPLFSMIDRRGQGINHWKALCRVKLSARFPSSLEAYTEGPWHVGGEWERVVGEHVCGRCNQNAFHIVTLCSPAKCPSCKMIVCNDCYRDFELLREYHKWLTSDDGQTVTSLFSLVFDLNQNAFKAAWENDPGLVLGLGVSHVSVEIVDEKPKI
jgi:curved DNA-binding protein CbpA